LYALSAYFVLIFYVLPSSLTHSSSQPTTHQTSHNLYLCFDLCTGGELFDRICAKGNYYEVDARALIRTIFKAVQYIHASGIVHRDLKPENLLFRTQAEDADIMIADFGLSRIMDEDKHTQLTEICGTPGYMAPEIFQKSTLPRVCLQELIN
jgi:calcium/calmodulin-dependent protein kinase I